MGFGGIVAEVGGIPPLFGGINLKIGGITLWVGGIHLQIGGIHPHSSKLTTKKRTPHEFTGLARSSHHHFLTN
ncbi:hypothetical protein [Neobacillus drentensis]|uniref:hypothetical protein n=1 Tax=Neobacillus drentensis TaxID=220684 RepID=UPI002FFFB7F5